MADLDRRWVGPAPEPVSGRGQRRIRQVRNPEAAKRREKGSPDETFVDLYVALATIPAIGRSLLGEAGYRQMTEQPRPGQHAILVMGNGRYSFKGRAMRGGIFDRIELVQDLESVRFRDKGYTRIGDLAAAGAPRFMEIGLFALPPETKFDPAQPWQLKLLVQRAGCARKGVPGLRRALPAAREIPEAGGAADCRR